MVKDVGLTTPEDNLLTKDDQKSLSQCVLYSEIPQYICSHTVGANGSQSINEIKLIY